MKIKSRDKISFKLQIFLLKTKYYYLMRQRRFAKHYPKFKLLPSLYLLNFYIVINIPKAGDYTSKNN